MHRSRRGAGALTPISRIAIVTAVAASSLWSPAPPAVADGGAKETIEGAVELLNKLHELVKKDADVGVYASAKVDGPDRDDFAKAADDKDLDDYIFERTLEAAALAAADNDVDDPPADNPYRPNVGHFASVSIKAHYEKPGGWRIVPPDPSRPADMGEVWTVAQDDNDEINTGQTTGAAVALFSVDGKDAEACFKAEVKNAHKNKGKAFEFAAKDVKKVPCSPLRPFRVKMGGYFLADEDMFQFQDLGGGSVRIIPLFGPVIDLFHTYWDRQRSNDLFPTLRGYEGTAAELRTEAYAARTDEGLHLTTDPAETADFTVAGAGLRFDTLDVPRAGRSNIELMNEYFASAAVTVVAPEHAQPGYRPPVGGRVVVHSGEDVSAFAGEPLVMPANDRRNEPGTDPMVGVLITVRGAIENAVELAANTPNHFVHRRLSRAWDGESDSIAFKLSGMASHLDESRTLGSTYG